MSFLDEDYLLETAAAGDLYDRIADLPIVDPHTHADIEEIVEDEGWSDLWQVEGATDHYVWSMMRKCGVDEELITGEASNREKWTALAEVVPEMAGNPVYEWLHLDLQRRFGIDDPVSAETADAIWEKTRERLASEELRPQALLEEMDVEVVGTTDDPVDELRYHERAREEVSGVDLRPTWRGDRAVNVQLADFSEFVAALDERVERDATTFAGFLDGLATTHDYFAERGCVACDVGVREPVSRPVSDERARRVFEQRLAGDRLTDREVEDFQAYLLEFVTELNVEKGWVTQLHMGPVRNYRERLYEQLGPASGGTVTTGEVDYAEGLRHFVNRFDGAGEVVLYCVDPTHYPTLVTVSRAFPNVSIGPAWWYNDSPFGMDHQLEYAGSVDLLANHAGMVSDSRKLLSFDSRFEMFRRSLANVVGRQVDRGQIPPEVAGDLVEHVAYDRPKELYGV